MEQIKLALRNLFVGGALKARGHTTHAPQWGARKQPPARAERSEERTDLRPAWRMRLGAAVVAVMLATAMGGATGAVEAQSQIHFTLDGVLEAGQWKTANELKNMSADDKRNTMIVEMTHHTNQNGGYFQRLNNNDLIGKAAIVVFLLKAGIRDIHALQNMSDDDQRNTLIVENQAHSPSTPILQGLSDQQLVTAGLAWARASRRRK